MTSSILEDVLHPVQGECGSPSQRGFGSNSSLLRFFGLLRGSLASGAAFGCLDGGLFFHQIVFFVSDSLRVSIFGGTKGGTIWFNCKWINYRKKRSMKRRTFILILRSLDLFSLLFLPFFRLNLDFGRCSFEIRRSFLFSLCSCTSLLGLGLKKNRIRNNEIIEKGELQDR